MIGAPAAILIAGYTLAAGWLFLFGDDPWPAGSWLVLVPGPLAGIAIFFGLTVVGHVFGRRAEAALAGGGEVAPPRLEAVLRRRAVLLLGLAGLVGLLEVATLNAFDRGQRRDREAAAELDENFAALVQTRHVITSVAARKASWGDAERGGLVMAIRLEGRRFGDYHIGWELTETLYDTPLLVGEERLTLVTGDTLIYVPIDLDTLRERYRTEVLHERGGVMVETVWPFTARLSPVLTRMEARDLPRRELQNLRLGYSELLSEAEAPVPIAFRID